jgi:hypothetical protein
MAREDNPISPWDRDDGPVLPEIIPRIKDLPPSTRGQINEILGLMQSKELVSGEPVSVDDIPIDGTMEEQEELRVIVRALIISGSLNRLSPEQMETINKLKERYENNNHNIQCHNEFPWSIIESRLKADPKKLDTLKKMEDSGGEPDVYKVKGQHFFFADLVEDSIEERSGVYYSEVEKRCKKIGADILTPEDFLYIGNELKVFKPNYDTVWLFTEPNSSIDCGEGKTRKIVKNPKCGSITYMGQGKGYCAEVESHRDHNAPDMWFRCSLKV